MTKKTRKTFVLGLSRTGTTSLHAAFVLMGMPSVHYPARAARYWMMGNFRPDTLADYDACLDLPTPLYYPDLDRRYPGSRFILLEREVEPWLDSLRRQWQVTPTPSDKTRLRDTVRIAVYGTARFNRARLRHVYQTHVRNVRDYFCGRPGDFLRMDVTQGDGWEKLGQFLEREPPKDMDFPRIRTPYIGPLAVVKRADIEAKRESMLALARGDTRVISKDIPAGDQPSAGA